MGNDDEIRANGNRGGIGECRKAKYDPNQLDGKQSNAWFNNDKDKRTKISPAIDDA